jgi:hypothetical protein
VPTFNVHAESRFGATINTTVDGVLEAATICYQFMTFPKVLMTRTFLVTDADGLDVSSPLFQFLLDTASSNPEIEDVPDEEINLAYELAVKRYRRLLASMNYDPPTVDEFTVALDSGDFEAGLAQFLAALADGDEGGQNPSAPEGTGQ